MANDEAANKDKGNRFGEISVRSAVVEELYSHGLLRLSPKQIDALAERTHIRLPYEMAEDYRRAVEHISEGDWIAAVDAVHLLSPQLGGDAHAKSAIAERIKDGAVECTYLWMSSGPDIGPINDSRPIVNEDDKNSLGAFWVFPTVASPTHCSLPEDFWSQSEDWDLDVKRWDWRTGTLLISWPVILSDGRVGLEARDQFGFSRLRTLASHVRFKRTDIQTIAKAYASLDGRGQKIEAPKRSVVKGNRASVSQPKPRTKKFDYAPVLARLESEILEGKYYQSGRVTEHGVQAMLERQIADAFASEEVGPSESTIRRKAQKLMLAWRALRQDQKTSE